MKVLDKYTKGRPNFIHFKGRCRFNPSAFCYVILFAFAKEFFATLRFLVFYSSNEEFVKLEKRKGTNIQTFM